MNPPAATTARRRLTYRVYVLCALALLLAFSAADRLAFGLMLQSIKVSLHLTDVQLGLLTGIAFALFYSTMGIPLSRLADRGDRVLLMAITSILWSILIACCGAASSFLQLFLCRVGVAVGEAGALPAAYSLISDYFSREERPHAVAILSAGANLVTTAVGDSLAGWLNQWVGWRLTFLALGLPGLVWGVATYATIREPRRMRNGLVGCSGRFAEGARDTPGAQPPLREVIALLWRNRTFRYLTLSYTVWYLFGVGADQWRPTFFIRTYGLHTGALGNWLMLNWMCFAAATYLGGAAATRFARRQEAMQLKASAFLYVGATIAAFLIYLAPTYPISFTMFVISSTLAGFTLAPMLALSQTLVPPEMRAMAITVMFLAANLFGSGLGPLAVGALSEVLRPALGEQSLRYALIATCPGTLFGAWYFWRASRTVASDLRSIGIASGASV